MINTVQLMEKAARLQVLSPVKRVVFPFSVKSSVDNVFITYLRLKHNPLTESVYTC